MCFIIVQFSELSAHADFVVTFYNLWLDTSKSTEWWTKS